MHLKLGGIATSKNDRSLVARGIAYTLHRNSLIIILLIRSRRKQCMNNEHNRKRFISCSRRESDRCFRATLPVLLKYDSHLQAEENK